MADEKVTELPAVDVVKPAKVEAIVKKRAPFVVLPVSGEPRLRLINVGTADECWQCGEVDGSAVRAAASAGEGGLSMKDGVAMFEGAEISVCAGS